MQVVFTVIILDGISGDSIRCTSARIVSLPRKSLLTENEVISGCIETASDTLSNPTANTFSGTGMSSNFRAVHKAVALKAAALRY